MSPTPPAAEEEAVSLGIKENFAAAARREKNEPGDSDESSVSYAEDEMASRVRGKGGLIPIFIGTGT